jgi:hypothetical protein
MEHIECIEEVFAFQNEKIDFFAALVSRDSGGSTCEGRIIFQGGKRWFFHRRCDTHAEAKRSISGLCEFLSEFYGAETHRVRFSAALQPEEFLDLLRSARSHLH